MNSIGGYFELELPFKEVYYPELIPLNSGRSCLEYILKAGSYSKIYLPYYICEVILELINKLGIEFEFYSINEDFTIKDKIILKETEVLLYVNYFGLLDNYLNILSSNYNNLIIDNAQAFYSKPIDNVITYYSPRKFFGVSDGGYLSTKTFLDIEPDQDSSYPTANYLLERIDIGAERGYQDFKKNEKRFSTTGIKKMSNLTSRILSGIDHTFVKQKREENFSFIHTKLKSYNQLNVSLKNITGPMIYPFLVNKNGLREFLISNKVFVAKYWDNVTQMCNGSSFENILANQLVALPIDQRYNETEMNYITNLIKVYCNFE